MRVGRFRRDGSLCNYRYTTAAGEAKTKITVFSYSNVGVRRARDIGAAALVPRGAAIFERPPHTPECEHRRRKGTQPGESTTTLWNTAARSRCAARSHGRRQA